MQFEPVTAQLAVFGVTVVSGLLLGLWFDVYRVLRGRVRPGPAATAVGDVLFWLIATVLTFALLMKSNWGELRLYVWVGLAAGALAYHFFWSRSVIRLLVALAMAAERVWGYAEGRIARRWWSCTRGWQRWRACLSRLFSRRPRPPRLPSQPEPPEPPDPPPAA